MQHISVGFNVQATLTGEPRHGPAGFKTPAHVVVDSIPARSTMEIAQNQMAKRAAADERTRACKWAPLARYGQGFQILALLND